MRALWLAVNEQFFARDPPPVETNEIKKDKATETTLTYAVTIKKWKTQTDKNGRERKNGKRNSRGRIILSTAHDFKHQHNISDFFFFPTHLSSTASCMYYVKLAKKLRVAKTAPPIKIVVPKRDDEVTKQNKKKREIHRVEDEKRIRRGEGEKRDPSSTAKTVGSPFVSTMS